MSSLVVFAIGVVVFAITVYGTVMAGGLVFTHRENAENIEVRTKVSDRRERRRGARGPGG